MLLRLGAILLVISLAQSQIISRNGKLEEQMGKFRTQIDLYDQLIEKSQDKLKEDLENCIQTAKESNCSKLKVWQHERVKHSKNITNLENKIKNHQQTIQNIIKMSQEETHKKSLTLQRLLPELIKVKNDIEYIEGIQFLIQDTYLNIDDSKESILNIFDTQFGNPIQIQLLELMRKSKYDHDPGARPVQDEQLPEKPEEEPATPRIEYNQGPPLIDEVIFDGHTEQYPQASVRDLFNLEAGEEPPVADIIPDAVDVPEHDKDAVPLDLPAPEAAFENLQVVELQESFKQNIKAIGQDLYDKLEALRKALCIEQDRLAQAVADLEKAILNLHHRHARQIVQIYIESKRLQRLVFEKDDMVLHLDGIIHDCTNLQQKLKNCESNKGFDMHYIQDLKQQKELNMAILKELEKLQQYDDKNIDAPVVPIEEGPSPQTQAIQQEIEAAQKEMHQIAEAEKQVKQEATKEPQKEAIAPIPKEEPKLEAPAEPPKQEEAPAQPPAEQPVQVEAPVVKPEEEKPAEEKPAAPAEEKPAAPAEEKPAAPAEEKPAEPVAEEKPAEPAAEEKPAEEKPAEEKPAEEKPAEEKPAEEKPAEEKPAEEKPAEEKPAEEKPAEEKPAEEKPAEEKPAEEKPAEEKPAEEKPAEEKPAEEKPAEEKPAKEKPAEEKPAEEKPAEEKPAEEKPAEEKPAEEKPAEEKPAEEKPAEEKPAEEKPAEGNALRITRLK